MASTARAGGFIPELESTRGLAALLVARYHTAGAPLSINGTSTNLIGAALGSTSPVENAVATLLAVLLNGDGAVLYFFVLSGFVLARSLERTDRLSWRAALHFTTRRMLRIYPPVVFAVFAFVALYYGTGLKLNADASVYDAPSILRNVLLFDVGINGVTWTMQTELIAIPIVLLCVAAANRSAWGLLAIALFLIALSFTQGWTGLFERNGISRTAPLYAFAVGVLIQARGRSLVESMRPEWRRIVLAGAVMVFFLARSALGSGSGLSMLVHVAAASILVAIFAHDHAAAPAFLRSAAARMFGRLSFSFYLLHPLTMALAWSVPAFWSAAAAAGVPGSVLIIGLWAATTAAIMPLAQFSYRFIETPFSALGRRVGTSAAAKLQVPA